MNFKVKNKSEHLLDLLENVKSIHVQSKVTRMTNEYNWVGKYVLFRSKEMKDPATRVFYVDGGYGAKSGYIGTGVFGFFVIDREGSKIHCGDVERELDPEKPADKQLIEKANSLFNAISSGDNNYCPICGGLLTRVGKGSDELVACLQIPLADDAEKWKATLWVDGKLKKFGQPAHYRYEAKYIKSLNV